MASKTEIRENLLRAGTARLCLHMAKETNELALAACRMVAEERRPLKHTDYKPIERAIKSATDTLRFLHRLQTMTLENFERAPGDPGLKPGSDAQLERALRGGD